MDRPAGRSFTRRDFLKLAGAAGAAEALGPVLRVLGKGPGTGVASAQEGGTKSEELIERYKSIR